jgi:hypothetical protein
MVTYGVIRQIGENSPFVYCMCETEARAKSIASSHKEHTNIIKDSRLWVAPVKDNACIGDDYYEVKL